MAYYSTPVHDDMWILKWKERVNTIEGYGYTAAGERTVVHLPIQHYLYIDTVCYDSLLAARNTNCELVAAKHDELARASVPSDPLSPEQKFTRLEFSTHGELLEFKKNVGIATTWSAYSPRHAHLYESEQSNIIKTVAGRGRAFMGWASHENTTQGAQAHLCVLSFDIETRTPVKNAWPYRKAPDDIIFTIALAVADHKRGPGIVQEVILVVADAMRVTLPISSKGNLSPIVDMVPGKTVYAVLSEKELLMVFFERIQAHAPDIITGHNIMGYDIRYINARVKLMDMRIPQLSRYSAAGPFVEPYKTKRWLRGIERSLHGWDMLDISIIDTCIYAVQDMGGLKSHKLEDLSRTYLGSGKTGLGYDEMFTLYDDHTLPALRRIVEYCSVDALLALQLFQKLNMFEAVLQKSILCATDIETLYTAGPMTTINNTVFQYMKQHGIVHNARKRERAPDEKYKGGYVALEHPGRFGCTTMLDFTSLYPSVMMDRNICVSTVVHAKEFQTNEHCDKIDVLDDDFLTVIGSVWFVKKSIHVGIVPGMIQSILDSRRAVQRRMKATTDPIEREMLNKRQAALKVVANATYGAFGSRASILYSIACAKSVTSYARHSIITARDIIQSTPFRGEYSKVIYIDTDSCYTTNEAVVDKATSMELAAMINTKVQEALGVLMELKYEDTCSNIVLLAKKHYIARMLNNSLMFKGVSVVRSDTCALLKTTYTRFAEMCIGDETIDIISTELLQFIDSVKKNRIPPSELACGIKLSKKITKYAQATHVVHLYNKMELSGRRMERGWPYECIYKKTVCGNLFGTVSYKYHDNTFDMIMLLADYNASMHAPDDIYYLQKKLLNGILRLLDTCGKLKDYIWFNRGSKGIEVNRLIASRELNKTRTAPREQQALRF